jgi:hypothetical protein
MPTLFLIFLGINSFLCIAFILNQNDSSKDTASNSISLSVPNPLEQGTWICLFFQFFLLLLQMKLTEF